MTSYLLADDFVRPVRRVSMPRTLRIVAPGGRVHVVARCNNRAFFTSAADFEVLLAHLAAMRRRIVSVSPQFRALGL